MFKYLTSTFLPNTRRLRNIARYRKMYRQVKYHQKICNFYDHSFPIQFHRKPEKHIICKVCHFFNFSTLQARESDFVN